jgi:hypothetical protein
MAMAPSSNTPCVVYWSERACGWVKGKWLATGTYYELYDREQHRFVDGFTKACVFPSLAEAEVIAGRHPLWKIMPLTEAERLFLREGDTRP